MPRDFAVIASSLQEPRPGVLRILSLGDSFTAGYRVGQHETFSSLQEQLINREYGQAEVMVAEISDPANALYYLDQFGLRLKPHIVLLGITLGNDISQTYVTLDPQGSYILTAGGWQGSSREYAQAPDQH